MAYRQLKQKVRDLLRQADQRAAMRAIAALPARRVINPLFGLLHHGDPQVRWRAVTAMGVVTARLADHDAEGARVIMRRLMWHLNDESGGIGWGAPEAMGDIMARSDRLAGEYARILISYLNPHGNHLEHEGLQAGVLWAIARLGHARPALVQEAAAFLGPFLSSPDNRLRALAVLAGGAMDDPQTKAACQALTTDSTPVTLYWTDDFLQTTIGALAAERPA